MNNAFSLIDLAPMLPELNLALLTIVALLFGVYRWQRIDTRYVVLGSVILLVALALVTMGDSTQVIAMNGMFISDGFTRFAKILLLIAASLTLLISSQWLTKEGGKPFEFIILMLFSTLGLMLLISANDMLALYVSLELSSLALYVLAAFNRDNAKSSEAGLKYFVLGALSSGMLLFGISLIYGFTGTTAFDTLGDYFAQFGDEAGLGGVNMAIIVGMVLVIIGFCFKLSVVPFHMWTPDVYEGAPTPVTAFFAVAPKVAIMALFVRLLMQPFADLLLQWQQILIFASIASMLIGALGAMMQTNVKRLLAYSSIGHVGFMLMGAATGTVAGAQGVLIYLSLYVFMSAGAFGCLLQLQHLDARIETLDDFKGLSRTNPYLAGVMAVFIFSMAGIPPLAGFFGKMYVVLAAITNGLVWLAVIGLIISVIACYYYLKLIKNMYFDAPKELPKCKPSFLAGAAIAICAVITVAYIIAPALLITNAQIAAESLLQ